MSYVLITGASSGLGEEFARQFAAQGKNLILVARSTEKLKELARELKASHSIVAEVITADLSKPGAAQEVSETCSRSAWEVDILINNAGLGLFGNLVELEMSRVEELMMINMVSLTLLARAFLPGMVSRKSGGVINVSSTAAFQPIPHFAAYAASKAYVLSLTEALHEEVRGTGVKMMTLCPGPTETRFFDRAAEASGKSGGVKIGMKKADEVVRIAISRFECGSRVVVPGIFNKMSAISAPLAPRSLATKIAGKLIKAGTGMN